MNYLSIGYACFYLFYFYQALTALRCYHFLGVLFCQAAEGFSRRYGVPLEKLYRKVDGWCISISKFPVLVSWAAVRFLCLAFFLSSFFFFQGRQNMFMHELHSQLDLHWRFSSLTPHVVLRNYYLHVL